MRRLFSFATALCFTLVSASAAISASFTELGAWPGFRGGEAHNVIIRGTYAYVAAGTAGLLVLDISDPSRPHRVRSIAGDAYWVENCAQFIVVADNQKGCRIFSLADPANPVDMGAINSYEGTLQFSGSQALATLGSFAFVNFSGSSRPLLIDFSRLPNSLPEKFSKNAIASSGPLKFGKHFYYPLDDSHSGSLLDPVTGAELNLTWSSSYARASAQSGNFIYFRGAPLMVFDDSPSDWPLLAGSIDSPFFDGLAADGDFLYGTTDASTLCIYSITDRRIPALVSTLQLRQFSYGVTVTNGYAYLGALSGGVQIIDVRDPSHPKPIASFDLPSDGINKILLQGNRAFTAAGYSGVRMVDISNPSAMAQIGRPYQNGGIALDLQASGNEVYLASRNSPTGGPFQIVNFDDPNAPALVSSYGDKLPVPIYYAESIALAGNTLFVAGERSIFASPHYELDSVDVTDPTNPRRLFYTSDVADSYALLPQRGGLLLNVGTSVLSAYDISDPSRIARVGGFRVSNGEVTSLGAVANTAFLGSVDGMKIVDFTNPSRLTLLATYSSGEPVRAVAASGNLAFILEQSAFKAFDVIDPTAPALIYSTAASNSFYASIAVTNDLIYATDVNYGMRVFRVTTSPRIAIRSPATGANIAGGQAEIEWTTDGIISPNWQLTFEPEASAAIAITASIESVGAGDWLTRWKVPNLYTDGCNFRIRVRDTATGAESLSGPLCLAPTLKVSLANGRVSIQWPDRYSTYKLFSAPDLASPWQPVTGDIGVLGDYFHFEAGPQTSASFYRLQK